MITGENWKEQECFEAHGSAVMVVTGVDGCAAARYEVRLEGVALGNYATPFDIAVYIWDDRDSAWCRDFYHSTFTVGSCWRISGRIEYEDGDMVFVDPVYMPFDGHACDLLRQHVKLKAGG